MRVYSNRETDEMHLMMLHLTEVEGLSCKKAGEYFGKTKNSVIGVRNRVKNDEITCNCVDPRNQNGGMRPLWWQRGR